MTQQLPLEIAFSRRATFANFVADQNDQMLEALETWTRGNFKGELFYLWGGSGSGRSHLLCAASNAAQQSGLKVAYIPLRDHAALTTAILEGLEHCNLVCLDDVNAVSGDSPWEAALFHLYNRVRDAGNRMLASADCSPLDLPCQLPDLKTRFAWGLGYHLLPLTENGKRDLLRQQANERGLDLSPEAVDYLLARFPRDTKSLVNLITKLDTASLAAQRRLTIPFLRSQISSLIQATTDGDGPAVTTP